MGRFMLVAFISFTLCSQVASGETRTWTGATDSDWFNPDNWGPAGLPASSDALSILEGTAQTDANIYLGDGGSLLVHGEQAVLESTFGIFIGDGTTDGAGALTISGGGSVSASRIPMGIDGHSVLLVTGTGTNLTLSGGITTGYGNSSSITFADGAVVSTGNIDMAVTSSGSTNVLVTDPGTRWSFENMMAGYSGACNITVANGAIVTGNEVWVGRGSWTGTLKITDPGSQWHQSGSVSVKSASRFDVENGGLASGTIGEVLGEAYVTGDDSTWNLSKSLWAKNILSVSAGGDLFSSDSYVQGTMTVDGPGSTWTSDNYVRIGYEEVGTLRILNGALVTSVGYGRVGSKGASGSVHVFGNGSTWSPNAIQLGFDAYGSLSISSGGTVTCNKAIYVGYGSSGSLTITSESELINAGDAFISYAPTGSFLSKATISGFNSRWTNSGILSVGAYGLLELKNAGYVSCDTGVIGEGSADIYGGLWEINGSLYVGGNADESLGGGSMLLDGSGTVDVAEYLKIWDDGSVNLVSGTLRATSIDNTANGSFSFEGGTVQTEQFLGSLISHGGTFSPGASPCSAIVTGDYSQDANSILVMGIAGRPAGLKHDVLAVFGQTALAGTLDIRFEDGYMPVGGENFHLFNFSNLEGQFDAILLPELDGEMTWNLDKLYSDGTVSIVPEPASFSLLLLGAVAMLKKRIRE